MTVRTIVLVLTVAAGWTQSAAAAQTSPLGATPISAEALAPGPTPLRVTGTLQTYDADQKQVGVTTPAGSLKLLMTRDTRVRQGGHNVDAGQLRNRIGSRVVVRYLEADRGRVLVSLTVIDRGNNGPR